MKRRRTRSRNAGFTLVEALFATLLMAVVLGALATVTAQWLNNWDRGFARIQRIELLAAGLDRLVEDLAAAEVVSAGDANELPIFVGSELSVTFVRTTIGPNAFTGLEVVQISETRDDRGPVLVRSTAPFAPLIASSGAVGQLLFSNPVVVIRAPYRVLFSYAGADHAWRPTWQASAQLPRAVRVRIRDAATSMTLAVSTSTLVRAELSARCVAARVIAECPALQAAANMRADATRPRGINGLVGQ